MSKRIWIVLLIFGLIAGVAGATSKIPFFMATSTIGGATGALDAIDGQSLTDGCVAIVVTSSGTLFYMLDDDSAGTESDPSIVSPDTNAGDKRWILKTPKPETATTTQLESATADINVTGKYTGKPIYNTTTGIMVWASGATATSKWKEADETDEHTPS